MKKLILTTIVLFNFLVAYSQENINYTAGLDYLLDKKYNEAVAKFTEAIKIEPDNAIIYNYRGLAYLSLQDFSSSMKDFNKAIQINPKENEAYCNRGYLKMNLEDYRGAILDFDVVVLESEKFYKDFGLNYSSNSRALSYRAMSKLKLNNYTGALDDAVKTINLYPTVEDAYYVKGICEFNLGDKENACKSLGKAGELGKSEAYKLIKTYCN